MPTSKSSGSARSTGSARRAPADDSALAALGSAEIEVRRSARRRRTVSAYREGDRVIVLMPARMSRAEEQRWVRIMLERLAAQERRRGGRATRSDDELSRRAAELSRTYLSGSARPSSVRWVSNQASRWGSCTPVDGTIRLSDRLRTMPSWVIDYVLVHELAHLLDASHGPRFQELVGRYPKAERARGYLLGVVEAPEGATGEPDEPFDCGDGDLGEPGQSAPVRPAPAFQAAARSRGRSWPSGHQSDALW